MLQRPPLIALRHATVVLLANFILATMMPAIAQFAPGRDFQAEVWAASCAACHGTDGKAQGTGLYIAGKSEAEQSAALIAYKNGQRFGTIMPKHAKGYSDEELRRIARYFANVK